MAGPSCGELPGCLGPHFLSTKCPTSLEQSGASQTLHPPAVTPGTVSGLGGAPPGIWQLWAPTHYCKPLWTAPTPSPPSRRTAPSEPTQAPSVELLGLSSLCLLEGLPDQACSCTGHPTKCCPSAALLSTGALEQAPALLAPHGTWPGRAQWPHLPMPSTHPVGNGALNTALESQGGPPACLQNSKKPSEAARAPRVRAAARCQQPAQGTDTGEPFWEGRPQTPHSGLSHPPDPASRGHGADQRHTWGCHAG